MSYGLDTESLNVINHSALFNLPSVNLDSLVRPSKAESLNYLLQKMQNRIELKDKISNSSSFENQLKVKELEIEINSIKEQIKSL